MIDIRELYNMLVEDGVDLPPFDISEGTENQEFIQDDLQYFNDGGEIPPIKRNLAGFVGNMSYLNETTEPFDLSRGNTSSVFQRVVDPEQVVTQEQVRRTLADLLSEDTSTPSTTTTTTTTSQQRPTTNTGKSTKSTGKSPEFKSPTKLNPYIPLNQLSDSIVEKLNSANNKTPSNKVVPKNNGRHIIAGVNNLTTGTVNINGKNIPLQQLVKEEAEMKKKLGSFSNFSSMAEYNEIAKRRKLYSDSIKKWNQDKANVVSQDARVDSNGIMTFNGKKYNLRGPKQKEALSKAISASGNPIRNRLNYWGELLTLNGQQTNKVKSSQKDYSPFEEGGELEYFITGGELSPLNIGRQTPNYELTSEAELEMRRRNNVLQGLPENYGMNPGPDMQLTGAMENQIQQSQFMTPKLYTSVSGETGFHKVGDDYYNNNVRTAESNFSRYTLDGDNNLKRVKINEGDLYDSQLNNINDSELVRKKLEEQRGSMDQFFDILGREQEYEIGDDLRFIGEAMAFDANDYDYATDGARKVAKGANLTKGVFAGLDAIIGGARDLYGGYATQKRSQESKLNLQKKQRQALENQKMMARGGRVSDIMKMFEEEQEQEQQDYRSTLPTSKLMTGEYIQQNPGEKGEYNAEVETKEFLQHPDGMVQRVVGRTHKEGGERLNLEEGTMVISDKVKVGKDHAKLLSDQLGIKVNSSDTYAKVIAKFSKEIGIDDLNAEQEKYFNILETKTNSKTTNDITTELNNEFLSGKINDLENKKNEISTIREAAVAMIYDLQERNKEEDPNFGEFALGGELERFDDGGKKSSKPVYSFDEYLKYIEAGKNNPQYKFKDVMSQASRLKLMAGLYDVDLTDDEIDTQEKQDNVARLLQNDVRNKYSGIAKHYSSNVAPTQNGLQSTLDSGLLNEKDLSELGVRVRNGKVLMGSFDVSSVQNRQKLTQLTQTKGKDNPEAYDKFVGSNFNDGKWYYRFPELNTVGFEDEATRDAKMKEKGYELVSSDNGENIYFSNTEGQYFRTVVNPKETETPNPGTPTQGTPEMQVPSKTPYRAPIIPSQRPVTPSAASPVPLYQTRLDRIDPARVGFDEQASEINRQASASLSALDGLTDQQRASVISNMTANTQNAIGDVVNQVANQNTANLVGVQQFNIQHSNAEEQARIQNAMTSDTLWGRTEANMEADKRDYLETLQRNRISKFKYLTQDRQMHDMIENFRVGRDGGIQFDEASKVLFQVNPVTGEVIYKDKNGKQKIEKQQVTTKPNGEVTQSSSTTSITKS